MTLKLYGQVWMNFDADGDMYESQATTFNRSYGVAGRYEEYTAIDQTADDNDLGWVIGVNSNIEQFHFGLAYAYVEADSLYGYLSDADFGIDPTNKEGIRANIGYDITKNWAIDFNFFYTERIEDLTNYTYDNNTDTSTNNGKDSVDDKTTYQLDVSYKF
jgi:hypothetical protein